MGRIGLFGGTFDPIHLGHLLAAEAAREALALDAVWFLPAARSPFKPGTAQSSAEDRLAMAALAVADQPAFQVSRADLDLPPPSYTVDLLTRLGADRGGPPDFVLLLGADALAGFPDWRAPERILALAELGAVARPGHAIDWPALEARLPGLRDRTAVVPGFEVGISATDLRRRVAEGRSIRFQVPASVEAFIRAHGLYRTASA